MKNTKSLLVLLITVLLTGGILLFADSQLRPIIDAAGSSEDQAVLETLFAGETAFTPVEFTDETGLIKKVYEAGESGYAYIIENQGFADVITFALALDKEGNITGYEIINLNDTPGYGSQVGEDAFKETIVGKTSTDAFATISGATVSSSAVVDGLNAAKAHYNETMGIVDDGTSVPETPAEPVEQPITFGQKIALYREVSEKKMGVVTDTKAEGDITTFTVEANGYAVTDGGYEDAKPNVITVKLNTKEQTIVSVEIVEANDTNGIGTKVEHKDFLAQFENLSYADEAAEVDTISTATISSTSIINGILAAIEESK
ncbi:FMN-binding protein [Proteiniclasticum sp.]|uniref:FMN-binding protein n=1 Tax=Proteiniclasticum sp. TaxID=2053595 RepID=UPI00289FF268|nr:FMN-binding protein [Proteiniclasticum sp.]